MKKNYNYKIMNIVLASDHGGFKMKEYLKKKLVEKKR